MNSLVLAEIRLGILLLPAGEKRRRLDDWFARVMIATPCISWDAETGLCWAELVADLRQRGQSIPTHDGMIAANALRFGLTVATRNVRDFERCGVPVFNPFEEHTS